MQSGQGWATQNDRHVINQAITLIECDWMRKKKEAAEGVNGTVTDMALKDAAMVYVGLLRRNASL